MRATISKEKKSADAGRAPAKANAGSNVDPAHGDTVTVLIVDDSPESI